MRFRRRRPGYRYVKTRDMVALLQNALRVTELEIDTERMNAEMRDRERVAAARVIVTGCGAGRVLEWSDVPEQLLVDLPQMADGSLHVEAFTLLLDQRVWSLRLGGLDTNVGGA